MKMDGLKMALVMSNITFWQALRYSTLVSLTLPPLAGWMLYAATPALIAFGEVAMAWRLLDLAIIAYPPSRKKGKESDFYKGKVLQATFGILHVPVYTFQGFTVLIESQRDFVP
jgi:Acetyl-CoA dehydrogenase C-terminal like